jgi:hypothetical protein
VDLIEALGRLGPIAFGSTNEESPSILDWIHDHRDVRRTVKGAANVEIPSREKNPYARMGMIPTHSMETGANYVLLDLVPLRPTVFPYLQADWSPEGMVGGKRVRHDDSKLAAAVIDFESQQQPTMFSLGVVGQVIEDLSIDRLHDPNVAISFSPVLLTGTVKGFSVSAQVGRYHGGAG